VEDIEFLAPFKFYRDDPRALTLQAVFHPDGEEIVADCRLLGQRVLANRTEPQLTEHFRGRVRLGRTPFAPSRREVPRAPANPGVRADHIYRVYFHGPAYRVLDTAWPEQGRALGLLAAKLPPDTKGGGGDTLTAPRLIELAFQTAGVWDLGVRGRFALPRGVDRIRLGSGEPPQGPVWAVVTPAEGGEHFDADIVDETGSVLASVQGYRTVDAPAGVDADALRPLQLTGV
jgi:hypothetical protein